jgi:hypothetical protein
MNKLIYYWMTVIKIHDNNNNTREKRNKMNSWQNQVNFK